MFFSFHRSAISFASWRSSCCRDRGLPWSLRSGFFFLVFLLRALGLPWSLPRCRLAADASLASPSSSVGLFPLSCRSSYRTSCCCRDRGLPWSSNPALGSVDEAMCLAISVVSSSLFRCQHHRIRGFMPTRLMPPFAVSYSSRRRYRCVLPLHRGAIAPDHSWSSLALFRCRLVDSTAVRGFMPPVCCFTHSSLTLTTSRT